ncbi:hypothetical protein JL720_3380 [Aureococcus anophagefferens]|nr:hypothetical protein JL720_3380 [Aureococcus anophagefferens]
MKWRSRGARVPERGISVPRTLEKVSKRCRAAVAAPALDGVLFMASPSCKSSRAAPDAAADGRAASPRRRRSARGVGAAGPAFDDVVELAEAENATAFAAMPEFVAFRTFVTANKLQSRHAAWTDRDNFNNRAVSDLRLAKIRALEAALKRSRASAVVFLDADTVVCRSLLKYGVRAERRDVAFVPVCVPVPAEKLHASPQLRRTYGVAPETPEANTGALFLRRTPKALSLLRYWGLRYGELRAADPPQLMDQVAFRAALHASRAKWLPVEERANCRGRDHLTRAHAPLACDGVDSRAPQLREQIMKHTGSFVSRSDDPETSLKALRAMEHVVEALDGGRARDRVGIDRRDRGRTSETSGSVTSKSIRLMFGRID